VNPRLKICFVCNEYPPMPANGIGVFVQTLAEQLAGLGADVWVVGYGKKDPKRFTQNGVQVHWIYLPHPLHKTVRIQGYPVSIARLIKRFYLSLSVNQLVRQENINLVESHDFSGPLAFRPPCPLVVRLHGSVLVYRHGEGRPDDMSPLDRHFEIKQVRMANYLVGVSHHIDQETRQVMKLDQPCEVIYNGVDSDYFRPVPPATTHKQILFVGNLMWRKGVLDLLHAMPEIYERHPDAELIIAGGAGGQHSQQLTAELETLPSLVRQRVKLIGNVSRSRLPELYNNAAVFVFPSRVEAFGLTCAEAMACGRPVVATSLASGPELVEDGISGLLADPRDPAELASKVCAVLEDKELARRLGTGARQRVLDNFNLHDLGNKNLAFYRSIIP